MGGDWWGEGTLQAFCVMRFPIFWFAAPRPTLRLPCSYLPTSPEIAAPRKNIGAPKKHAGMVGFWTVSFRMKSVSAVDLLAMTEMIKQNATFVTTITTLRKSWLFIIQPEEYLMICNFSKSRGRERGRVRVKHHGNSQIARFLQGVKKNRRSEGKQNKTIPLITP